MLRFMLIAAAALSFAACGGNKPAEAGHDHAGHDHAGHDHAGHDHSHAGHDHAGHHATNENATSPDGIHYGANTAVTADGATPLADVIAKLQAKQGLVEVVADDESTKAQGLVVKVEGTVSDVCKKQGCWFKLATTDGKEMFISMKDHKGMPLDIVGKTVVAEGNAFEMVTSVAELQHYAQDKGASKEEIAAITQPKTEYKFYAVGVMLK